MLLTCLHQFSVSLHCSSWRGGGGRGAERGAGGAFVMLRLVDKINKTRLNLHKLKAESLHFRQIIKKQPHELALWLEGLKNILWIAQGFKMGCDSKSCLFLILHFFLSFHYLDRWSFCKIKCDKIQYAIFGIQTGSYCRCGCNSYLDRNIFQNFNHTLIIKTFYAP